MDEAYNRIPIIKLWHLLLVPLQGELTDNLADQLTTDVLDRIYRDGASGLIVDITALWMVDSHLCSVLSQLSAAASLMGAKTIISGMKPEIALTLETMGVQLNTIVTTLTLEDALDVLGARTVTNASGQNAFAVSSGDTAPDGAQDLAQREKAVKHEEPQ